MEAPGGGRPAGPSSRTSGRVPVAGTVELRFERFSGFIREYAANLSLGGMFVRTASPKPAGTLVNFEFRLADDYPLISGTGEVVWTRWRDGGPEEPAGMGVRFQQLDPRGRELISTIVAERQREGAAAFDLAAARPPVEEPPAAAVAPGALWEPESMTPLAPPGKSLASMLASVPAWTPPTPSPEPAPAEPRPTAAKPPADRPFHAADTGAGTGAGGRLGGRRGMVLAAVVAGLALLGAALWLWVAGPTTSAGPPTTPAASAAPPTAAEPAAPAPAPAVTTRPPPAPPPAAAPFRAVERITWERQGAATVVTVWTDGAVAAARFTSLRIDAGPRVVVKLHGVERPFSPNLLPVGTPELRQIRVGYHVVPAGADLHLVFDLAAPEVALLAAEPTERGLRLRLGPG